MTSVVVAVVRFRMKMLIAARVRSVNSELTLVGGVKSVPLAVRSVTSLVNATDLPSGLKTTPELSPWTGRRPLVVTLSRVVVPVARLRRKRFSGLNAPEGGFGVCRVVREIGRQVGRGAAEDERLAVRTENQVRRVGFG